MSDILHLTAPILDHPEDHDSSAALDVMVSLHINAAPGPGGFWHPDLPEVASSSTRRYLTNRGPEIETLTLLIRRPPVWTFTPGKLSSMALVLLLSLLLPLAAHAEPCKVNIQTANVAQVAFLPGIGPAKAGEIVKAHPKNESELDAVKGIGPATLEALRPFVVYQGETTCTSKQKAQDKE